MKTINKTLIAILALSALVLSAGTPAFAGRGGSNSRIKNAVQTGSAAAIIAELERAERLVCGACVPTVEALLQDERYDVREAAAWWFTHRPAQKRRITETSLAELAGTDSVKARNAADILGAFEDPAAIEALGQAARRTELSAEARLHAVRALGEIGHADANPALSAALSDTDASVRLAAVEAWNRIRHQDSAAPVVPLLADTDNLVRRQAAAVVGALRDATARAALEAQLADTDPAVRRNAAWALGRIGDMASRPALQAAVNDASPLVRMSARAALRELR